MQMDESILDADQVDNLIKFCPTKHEMELLMNYTGDTDMLHKCEQFFLELMKVPRVGSKLKYCLLKVQSDIQFSELKKNLNQRTTRCSAVGFKLDSLLERPAPLPPSRGSTPPMYGGAPSPPPPPPLSRPPCAPFPPPPMPTYGAPSSSLSAAGGHPPPRGSTPPMYGGAPSPPPPPPLSRPPCAPFPPPPMPTYGAPSSSLSAAGGHPPPPPPPPHPMRGPPRPPPRSCIMHGNPPPGAPAPPPLPSPPPMWGPPPLPGGSLWEEMQRTGEPQCALDFYVSELETQFSAIVPKKDTSKGGGHHNSTTSIPEIEHLALSMDELFLDADNIEKYIQSCHTKKELEFVKPPPPGCGPPPPPGSARGPPPCRGRGRGRGPPPRRSTTKPLHWSKVTRALQGSVWEELQRLGEPQSAPDFDLSEIETLFSAIVPKKKGAAILFPNSDKVHLIDLRRANNTEIMLTKVKMPVPDMMAATLAMDESILHADQVENLLKFCPTKDEQKLLQNYTGDRDMLGTCEQYFLELMKVPRLESKLEVFLFKIQFNTQLSELKKKINTVNSACDEVRTSVKLKEILKRILFLGNTLNQGTARGAAVGFKLDSLLKLKDTRSSHSKMTLMHYLCKVLASKSPALLDFHEDLVSLESATKIQLKSLAEEMQAIIKGLEKAKQELDASAYDGPVSENFRKTLNQFLSIADTEVGSVTNLYSLAGINADGLSLYFGEDPVRCPFEQATLTLWNFVRLFREVHEENYKQAELEEEEESSERGLNQEGERVST